MMMGSMGMPALLGVALAVDLGIQWAGWAVASALQVRPRSRMMRWWKMRD
jgi:hypothetical protein